MPEVSVVIPSLNEEKTIGNCIRKVKAMFEVHHIDCVVPNVLTLYTPPHFQNFLTIKHPFV